MNTKRGLLLLLIVLLIVFSVVNFIIVTTTTITGKATDTAAGTASICISRLPAITAIADQTATVDTAYTLQVEVKFQGSNTSLRYLDNTSLFGINQSGYISFTPSSSQAGTHSILITAEDTSDCVAMNATATFQLTISAAGIPAPPAEEAAPSAGGGGGGGAGGYGRAIAVPLHSFQLSEEAVKATVKQSQSVEKVITITNDGKVPLTFKLTNPLTNIISLFPKEFTLLPEEQKKVSLLINPQRDAVPNIYTGIITVAGGPLRKNIILIIEVESDRVLFDGSIELRSTVLHPGEDLDGTYSITGLLPATVSVTYTVSDLDGNLYYSSEEKLTIEHQVSFAKSIPLPRDIPPGEYLVAMRIIYGNSFATATERFTVERRPTALVGLAAPLVERPWIILIIPSIILLVLVIIIISYVIYRRVETEPRAAAKAAVASTPATSTTIIERNTTIRPTIRPPIVGPSPKISQAPPAKTSNNGEILLLQRKLAVLREGYQKKLIRPETYYKAKAALEDLLAQKRK